MKIRTAKLSQGEFTSPLSDNFKHKLLEDSLTGEATAQINCAYAFVAGVCLRSHQSNFTLKLL